MDGRPNRIEIGGLLGKVFLLPEGAFESGNIPETCKLLRLFHELQSEAYTNLREDFDPEDINLDYPKLHQLFKSHDARRLFEDTLITRETKAMQQLRMVNIIENHQVDFWQTLIDQGFLRNPIISTALRELISQYRKSSIQEEKVALRARIIQKMQDDCFREHEDTLD